jgi:hypothetical protein
MLEKIDELRLLAREAAIKARSPFDEPTLNVMWLRDGKVILTLYAPSLTLHDGKKNHEYVSECVDTLTLKIDDIINKAKSELYEKNHKS